MNRPSFLLLTGIIASASSAIAAYDGSWTNSYTWTEAIDQTVTSAPTVPTVYRGNTVFTTKIGGTGNATVAIFSGGTVDVQGLSSDGALLKDDNGVFRLAVVDNATVTLSKQQYWYGKDCHFELVDGTTLQKISSWEETDYAVGCITVFCGEVRLIDNIKYKEL